MNLVSFIKLLYSKLTYIIIIPLVFGFITFLITRNLPERYTSTATLFTGITSNTGLEMMGTRIDNVQTLNEYNNVLSIMKSRSLAEETGLRLLAQHLMQDGPNGLIINTTTKAPKAILGIWWRIAHVLLLNAFPLTYDQATLLS